MTGSDNETPRPSPEALLKLAQEEETGEEHGKLKVFLGYAAGVGKTYAMLDEAQRLKKEGRDVVAAYVETHGRVETDALLAGLEILPRREVHHQGITLAELDLDALLTRRPEIALVDDLAHSNPPRSRHEKRWQDVAELLAARIDVYTTVNVQHFESLVDAVGEITGVVVRETVPDTFLDLAQEIRLVDIPPEDLLQRLAEGKVYVPQQATLAAQSFFKPGNLIALRELSLRRTAERVDDQMRAYMEARSIAGPWPVAERLLVAVSGSPFGERLIRNTKRHADEMKAPWHTLYIETPGGGRQLRENRARVWRDLRLAESLGAQVATVTADTVADALLGYAVRNNVTKIIMGKPKRPRWRDLLRQPLVDEVIRLSGPIDVEVMSFDKEETERARTEGGTLGRRKSAEWKGYLKSFFLVAGTTGLCQLLRSHLAPTNLMMVYLFAVILSATELGRGPSILTSLLSVFAFDFFFVPPRFTLRVSDTEYVVTFVAFFTVGAVISTLVYQARERAAAIREREAQTASLYHLSRDLAGASDMGGILQAVVRNVEESMEAQVAILLPEGEHLAVRALSAGLHHGEKEGAVADWVYRNRTVAGRGTETLTSAPLLYVPLETPAKVHGVLGVRLAEEGNYHSPECRRLMQAFATQASLAIERVHLTSQAEQAQILAARETLERALLNSISHDLRTPLVSISGVLDTLRASDSTLPERSRDLVQTASEQAERLNRFVGNLLDMTRLEAGALKLKEEPCDVQDLVGCALAALDPRLERRSIITDLPPDLPLLRIDLVLMTQVLVNLLDNSLKYSPPEREIEISARSEGRSLMLEISDRGPGVPEQDLTKIFDKFYRIPVPEGAGGTGLGLSICKGIVEVHGGKIRAENRLGGGLKMTITLPTV